jgi:transcription-repair coupling factor (superfamily II helicase)
MSFESLHLPTPGTVAEALFRQLRSSPEFASVLGRFERENAPVVPVIGLNPRSSRALAVAAIARATARRCAVVTPDRELDAYAEEVRFFLQLLSGMRPSPEAILTFPPLDVRPYDGVSPHPEIVGVRASTLYRLSRGRGLVTLIHPASLVMRVPAPTEVSALGADLTVGRTADYGDLMSRLRRAGYVQTDEVSTVGEFSVRGGILDVYPPTEPLPVRIEFCDDQIESLRCFDPETQRSVEKIESVSLVPLWEYAATAEDFRRWATVAPSRWPEPRFAHDVRSRCRLAEAGEPFPGWEFLLPLVKPRPATVADFLADALWILEEPTALVAEARSLRELLTAQYEAAHDASHPALEPDHFILGEDEQHLLLSRRPRVELYSIGPTRLDAEEGVKIAVAFPETHGRISAPAGPPVNPDLSAAGQAVEIRAITAPCFHGRIDQAIEYIRKAAERRTVPLIVARSKAMAGQLSDVLIESGLPVERLGFSEAGDPAFPSHQDRWPVLIALGSVMRGFELPAARLLVLTESDMSGDLEAAKVPAPPPPRAKPALSDLRDLRVGDYVVHIDHGIGQFQGLVLLPDADGAPHEFMLITYAEGAKLYVPVERLDLVQKYVSGDGHEPRLDRLGGTSWLRTKARVARSLRALAEELLSLYARRKLVPGHAFSPDTEWQKEFEAGFEYELTPDQQRAIEEVKADMERPIPMDRLLCGDVGFGKTEVAMRAAFKAVMEGKQVAVLAPTTVLAQQHYRTFTRRFAPFPVQIGALSRIQPPQQRQTVLRGLEEGTIDIVIGTHRLLSRDVRFRDLGLVIVDEEQRFGVSHKEKLKQLRYRVDVLTLTATPIPRTLNMALLGLRDLSVIQTPPRDRLAIQTIVAPFSPDLIRAAIERELERDGQVFFIHNRIESIYTMAALVKQLVPQARVGVTHAELSERELEKTMLRFVQGDLDVLVTTTIIENGIDIPRANTIIINHADRFGLADLYQLRGRVGRSDRRAYAYLLIAPDDILSPTARKRLAALKEFSDLGAGFRLAALDLELRGAGNLLGPEQSGHIRALGFELYCQLLERTIQELRGQPIEEEINTEVSLGLDLRIPLEYIPDMGQRLQVYKRISTLKNEAAMAALRDELTDRYGPLPESVENLFFVSRLRSEAARCGVLSLTRRGSEVIVTFAPGAPASRQQITSLTSRLGRIVVSGDGTGRISWDDLRRRFSSAPKENR